MRTEALDVSKEFVATTAIDWSWIELCRDLERHVALVCTFVALLASITPPTGIRPRSFPFLLHRLLDPDGIQSWMVLHRENIPSVLVRLNSLLLWPLNAHLLVMVRPWEIDCPHVAIAHHTYIPCILSRLWFPSYLRPLPDPRVLWGWPWDVWILRAAALLLLGRWDLHLEELMKLLL